MIRTVLGDVAPADLGLTYAHEHLSLHSALIAGAFAHILLDDAEIAATEVAACVAAGARTLVDAMPCASGRDVLALAHIAGTTGAHIVAVTGLHHPRYYGAEHWTARTSAEQLGALFALDVTDGIDEFDYTGPIVTRTPHRAGLIKVATGGGTLTGRDELLFDAAAIAHRATGAPILTHCEAGRGALEQIEAMAARGVAADVLLISHIDKVTDPGYHREIAAAGAWLVFDQALRQAGQEVPATARLIAELGPDVARKILLGTDGARRDLWTGYEGSPGLAWLAGGFPDALRRAGVAQEMIDAMFVGNPAHALSLR